MLKSTRDIFKAQIIFKIQRKWYWYPESKTYTKNWISGSGMQTTCRAITSRKIGVMQIVIVLNRHIFCIKQ